MAILIARLHFEDTAHAVDAFNQLEARATNTGIVGLGTESESTSYSVLLSDAGQVTEAFHIDTFGITREGEYEPPPNEHPLFIMPTGGHDSYPATNAAGEPTRVEHNGRNWLNTHGDGNSWEPGTVNDSIWLDEGEVST